MQITYKDKVTLQSNPNIPDENKVTAKDMNEIKSVVNSNEEEQQALNMSVQEIAQNVVNNSQEISNIKEEQTTQNDNIQTNSNNISDLQSNKADKNEIPTDLSQLSNENTKFVNETGLENAISQEKTQRKNADNNLQNQIDAITASTDVIDIVGTYQDLQDYDTSKVKQNDVIKVLQDSTHNNAMSYYRWQNQWIYVGSEGPYYTIGQTDELLQGKANQSDLNQTNTNVTNLAGRVSNNEGKIENLEQEQTEQNTNISTNATNIESLQEENESLKKIVSQLPQVEGQGTEVTLENTIEAPFTKFDVEGNSVQDGTPSPDNEVPILSSGDNENEFDKDNANILNAYIDYTNNLIKSADSTRLGYIKCQPNTTYTISKIQSSRFIVATTDTIPQNNVSLIDKNQNNSATNLTITTSATAKYLCVFFYHSSYDTTITEQQILETMKIEKGNKVTPYSPYGMGSINEKISNGNNFDGIMEQGDIPSYNGQNQNNTLCIRSKNYILLQPSTTYFFERFGLITDSVGLRFYDKDKNYLSSETTSIGYNVKSKAFTTGNNVHYMRFTDWTNNLTNTYMLSKGNKSVPYVPHEEQDYPIFVQQPMRSIGDVRDLFFKNVKGSKYYNKDLEENKWYERHYIGEYIFTGNETFTNTGTNRFNADDLISYIKAENLINYASNYYKAYKTTASNGEFDNLVVNEESAFNLSLATFTIRFKDTRFSTIQELQNWLAEKYASGNPLYVEYLLEEPLDLPCTETQIQQIENKPSTYKDFTIIQSEDETPAYLEVSGIYDMNKLITRVEVIESEV